MANAMYEKNVAEGYQSELRSSGGNAASSINLLTEALKNLAKATNSLKNTKGLQYYWKDNAKLVHELNKEASRFSQWVNKDNAWYSNNKTSAQAIMQMQSLAQERGLEYDNKTVSESILKMQKLYKDEFEDFKLNIISNQEFKQITDEFKTLEDYGVDINRIFSQLSNDSVSDLNQQLDLMVKKIDELQKKLNDSNIKELEDRVKYLREELQNYRKLEVERFKGKLLNYGLDPKNDTFSVYIDEITEGYTTAEAALTNLSEQYSHLFKNFNQGNTIDTSNISELTTQINSLEEKIDELDVDVYTKFSNITSTIKEQTDLIKQCILDIFNGESVDNIFSKILNNLSLNKGTSISSFVFSEEQLNNIITAFNEISLSLKDISKAIGNVGDGEEFKPLLAMLKECDEVIHDMSNTMGHLTDEGTPRTMLREFELLRKNTEQSGFNISVKEGNSLEQDVKNAQKTMLTEKEMKRWVTRYQSILNAFTDNGANPFQWLIGNSKELATYEDAQAVFNEYSLQNIKKNISDPVKQITKVIEAIKLFADAYRSIENSFDLDMPKDKLEALVKEQNKLAQRRLSLTSGFERASIDLSGFSQVGNISEVAEAIQIINNIIREKGLSSSYETIAEKINYLKSTMALDYRNSPTIIDELTKQISLLESYDVNTIQSIANELPKINNFFDSQYLSNSYTTLADRLDYLQNIMPNILKENDALLPSTKAYEQELGEVNNRMAEIRDTLSTPFLFELKTVVDGLPKKMDARALTAGLNDIYGLKKGKSKKTTTETVQEVVDKNAINPDTLDSLSKPQEQLHAVLGGLKADIGSLITFIRFQFDEIGTIYDNAAPKFDTGSTSLSSAIDNIISNLDRFIESLNKTSNIIANFSNKTPSKTSSPEILNNSFKYTLSKEQAVDFVKSQIPNATQGEIDEVAREMIKTIYNQSGFNDLFDLMLKYDASDEYRILRNDLQHSHIKYTDTDTAEFGDDWNKVRTKIGIKTLSKTKGSDIIEYLREFNESVYSRFDATVSNQDAFKQLYQAISNRGSGAFTNNVKSISDFIELLNIYISTLENVKKEEIAVANAGNQFDNATASKEAFAKANEHVNVSAEISTQQLNEEAEAANNVAKLIDTNLNTSSQNSKNNTTNNNVNQMSSNIGQAIKQTNELGQRVDVVSGMFKNAQGNAAQLSTSITLDDATLAKLDSVNNKISDIIRNEIKAELEGENVIITFAESMSQKTAKAFDGKVVDSFVAKIIRANGEIDTLKYKLNKPKADKNGIETGRLSFDLVGSVQDDKGTYSQQEAIIKKVAEYQAKIASFNSSTNGLFVNTAEYKKLINADENNLGLLNQEIDNLKDGRQYLKDLDEAFNKLRQHASDYQTAMRGGDNKSLNPFENRAKDINDMSDRIQVLTSDFQNLSEKPEAFNERLIELNNTYTSFINKLKETPDYEGSIEAAREFGHLKDLFVSLEKELSILKNNTKTVFDVSELSQKSIPYILDIDKSVDSLGTQVDVLKEKFNWKSVDFKGIDDANNKVKQLTLTVEESNGKFKTFNMSRQQINNNGVTSTGLVLTGDIKYTDKSSTIESKAKKLNAQIQDQLVKLNNLKIAWNDANRIASEGEGTDNYPILAQKAEEAKLAYDNLRASIEKTFGELAQYQNSIANPEWSKYYDTLFNIDNNNNISDKLSAKLQADINKANTAKTKAQEKEQERIAKEQENRANEIQKQADKLAKSLLSQIENLEKLKVAWNDAEDIANNGKGTDKENQLAYIAETAKNKFESLYQTIVKTFAQLREISPKDAWGIFDKYNDTLTSARTNTSISENLKARNKDIDNAESKQKIKSADKLIQKFDKQLIQAGKLRKAMNDANKEAELAAGTSKENEMAQKAIDARNAYEDFRIEINKTRTDLLQYKDSIPTDVIVRLKEAIKSLHEDNDISGVLSGKISDKGKGLYNNLVEQLNKLESLKIAWNDASAEFNKYKDTQNTNIPKLQSNMDKAKNAYESFRKEVHNTYTELLHYSDAFSASDMLQVVGLYSSRTSSIANSKDTSDVLRSKLYFQDEKDRQNDENIMNKTYKDLSKLMESNYKIRHNDKRTALDEAKYLEQKQEEVQLENKLLELAEKYGVKEQWIEKIQTKRIATIQTMINAQNTVATQEQQLKIDAIAKQDFAISMLNQPSGLSNEYQALQTMANRAANTLLSSKDEHALKAYNDEMARLIAVYKQAEAEFSKNIFQNQKDAWDELQLKVKKYTDLLKKIGTSTATEDQQKQLNLLLSDINNILNKTDANGNRLINDTQLEKVRYTYQQAQDAIESKASALPKQLESAYSKLFNTMNRLSNAKSKDKGTVASQENINELERQQIKLEAEVLELASKISDEVREQYAERIKISKVNLNDYSRVIGSDAKKTYSSAMRKLDNYTNVDFMRQNYSKYIDSARSSIDALKKQYDDATISETNFNEGVLDVIKSIDQLKRQGMGNIVSDSATSLDDARSKFESYALSQGKLIKDISYTTNPNNNGLYTFTAQVENADRQIINITANWGEFSKTVVTKSKVIGTAVGGFDKLIQGFSSKWVSLFQYFTAMYLNPYMLIGRVKSQIDAIVQLDTALVDLRKTATMSEKELNKFYIDSNKLAKQLGTTTQQIIQQAADWSRAGYSSYEDATRMAALSSQFAAISPDIETSDATTGLLSVMKAYGIQTENVLDGVMSKINAIGNTASTTNGEILTGLEKASASMSAANNTLDETIALFTAGQEIVQNAETVGQSLKTISMRIRGKIRHCLHM